MRVLIVHNRYRQPGGEDVVAEREPALLRSQGHEVIEYRRSNSEIEDFGVLAKAGLPLRTVWAADAYRDLRRIIREKRPDIVHVHNTFLVISPAAYAACNAEGVPVVLSLHNARLMCPGAWLYRNGAICQDCVGKPFAWPGVLHGCWRESSAATAVVATTTALHRWAGTWRRRIGGYIVFTQFFRDQFIAAGLPADKIHVKPHFIDPDPGTREGIGEDYALFIGRLEKVKGVKTMLEAWNTANAMRLKICGDGDLMHEVQRLAETAPPGMIEILGRQGREMLTQHTKRARFLVWPSEGAETFGLVAAEAFSCGVPVITTRFGPMAEMVEDGKTGLHFTLGDAADLAAKLRWAADHPEEMGQMGANARKVYKERFTPEANYRQLMSIYQNVIETFRNQD